MKKQKKQYWIGSIGAIENGVDDFGDKVTDEFIDGKTIYSSGAYMTPTSFDLVGYGIGVGYGQRYKKQKNGKWLLVEGNNIKQGIVRLSRRLAHVDLQKLNDVLIDEEND